jgi:hypothetical protein
MQTPKGRAKPPAMQPSKPESERDPSISFRVPPDVLLLVEEARQKRAVDEKAILNPSQNQRALLELGAHAYMAGWKPKPQKGGPR